MLAGLGTQLALRGDEREAAVVLDEAVLLARKSTDREAMVTSLRGQLLLALRTDRPGDAKKLALEALDQARLLHNQRTIAVLLNDLALALIRLGDFDEAARYLADAEKSATAGSDHVRSYITGTRAELELREGRAETARVLAAESIRLRTAAGPASVVIPRLIMARAFLHEGKIDEGEKMIAEIRPAVSDITEQRGLVEALEAQADASQRAGLLEKAGLVRQDAQRVRAAAIPIVAPRNDSILMALQSRLENRGSIPPQSIFVRYVYCGSLGVWPYALLLLIVPLSISALLIAVKATVLAALAAIYLRAKTGLSVGEPPRPSSKSPASSASQ